MQQQEETEVLFCFEQVQEVLTVETAEGDAGVSPAASSRGRSKDRG